MEAPPYHKLGDISILSIQESLKMSQDTSQCTFSGLFVISAQVPKWIPICLFDFVCQWRLG